MLLHDYQGKLLQLDFLLLEQQGYCCLLLGLVYLVLELDIVLDVASDIVLALLLFEE